MPIRELTYHEELRDRIELSKRNDFLSRTDIPRVNKEIPENTIPKATLNNITLEDTDGNDYTTLSPTFHFFNKDVTYKEILGEHASPNLDLVKNCIIKGSESGILTLTYLDGKPVAYLNHFSRFVKKFLKENSSENLPLDLPPVTEEIPGVNIEFETYKITENNIKDRSYLPYAENNSIDSIRLKMSLDELGPDNFISLFHGRATPRLKDSEDERSLQLLKETFYKLADLGVIGKVDEIIKDTPQGPKLIKTHSQLNSDGLKWAVNFGHPLIRSLIQPESDKSPEASYFENISHQDIESSTVSSSMYEKEGSPKPKIIIKNHEVKNIDTGYNQIIKSVIFEYPNGTKIDSYNFNFSSWEWPIDSFDLIELAQNQGISNGLLIVVQNSHDPRSRKKFSFLPNLDHLKYLDYSNSEPSEIKPYNIDLSDMDIVLEGKGPLENIKFNPHRWSDNSEDLTRDSKITISLKGWPKDNYGIILENGELKYIYPDSISDEELNSFKNDALSTSVKLRRAGIIGKVQPYKADYSGKSSIDKPVVALNLFHPYVLKNL